MIITLTVTSKDGKAPSPTPNAREPRPPRSVHGLPTDEPWCEKFAEYEGGSAACKVA